MPVPAARRGFCASGSFDMITPDDKGPHHAATRCIRTHYYPYSPGVEIDALAHAMDRSRNYIVNQAIEQYLEANAWQMERITAGVKAARAGKVQPVDEVFAGIAAKHGWSR